MKLLALFCLFVALTTGTAQAVELGDLHLGGRLKGSLLYIDSGRGAEDGLLGDEGLRLDLTGQLAEYDIEFSVEQQLLGSDPADLATLPDASFNRRLDLEQTWNRGERLESGLQVDRLNLQGQLAGTTWTIGRQAIGFGRISLFSPLDVIAPFEPGVLDSDFRPGIDALRLTRYFGLGGQIGGVAVFGDQPRHNSYLLTFSENLGHLDLLLLGGRLRDRPMAGIGLAGELGPLGLKGELSSYRGRRQDEPDGDRQQSFTIAALESWYRFDNGLVLLAEYLYNGPGSSEPAEYPLVAISAPLAEGLSFLLGRHYLLNSLSYQLHPLVTVSSWLVVNLEDSSWLLRPQLSVSLADNLQLDLFWSHCDGREAEFDAQTGLLVPQSEFGEVGDSGGVLLRWYF